MKKLYFLFLTVLISSASFGQDLIITGIMDGPLPGGLPKALELYVVNDIPDLSIYGIESTTNGTASAGQEYTFPTDSKTAGEYIYISTEQPLFNQYLGFDPTYIDNVVNVNGDDTIILYLNSAVYDLLGEIGVDGTGTAWESLDGWAYRADGFGPNTTFTASEWIFSGPNATDGCDLADDTGTNAGCASVFPIGSYSNTLSAKYNQIEDFKMYPNPTSLGYVNISSKSNAEMSVAVSDVLGKQILKNTVKDNTLDISSLKSGIYIMKVSQEDAITSQKLVIR